MKFSTKALALMMSVAALGGPVTAAPIPGSCEVLQAIDIAALLGAGTSYAPGFVIENESVRMSVCSADTPDLSVRLSLMVREDLRPDVPEAETLRREMIGELRATIGEDAEIDEVAIGDGAIWVEAIGQLTVWHREGRVMFIISPTPMQDRAAAEAAAQKTLAAFP